MNILAGFVPPSACGDPSRSYIVPNAKERENSTSPALFLSFDLQEILITFAQPDLRYGRRSRR